MPYNVAHVLGNIGFCLVIGPAFVRALRRYRRRFEVRWQPRAAHAGATIASIALVLAVVSGASLHAQPAVAAQVGTPASTTPATTTPASTTPAGAAPTTGTASKQTPAARALAYLLAAQNADGGFGPAPKQGSTALHSGWAVLGLAASDRNARDVKRGRGRTAASYVTNSASRLGDIGEVERTALVAAAMGVSPRAVAGHDLIAAILRRKRADGSIAGQISYTAFGVLALRAARQSLDAATIKWLLGSQNEDGGFGVVRGATSDADMTGVVLEALATVGRSASPVAGRAVSYLTGSQNGDGGFAQRVGYESNAQSSAYAVQGLVAVGADGPAVTRANRYLAGLQRTNGSIGYSASSSQTPVWVTAQALMALKKAPLPIAAAARKSKPKPKPKPAATTSESGAGGGAGAPAGGSGSSAATDAPATATPSAEDLLPGFGSAAAGHGSPAPATTTPLQSELSIPTPDADPADAASAQWAAAKAGDGGVPPGVAIGIGLALVALLALLWLVRRPLLAAVRRGGALLPARLRRSST
ncbi:MAG TPA: prenyltransferase/squalene oxidase repeat-containing protein [Thermoleophilaceae bacterium]